MILSHIDVVRLFDIDLSRRRRIPALDTLLDTTAGSSAFSRYVESFEWLFEAQCVPVNSKFRNVDPTVRFLSPSVNCPYSLEHFDRFALRADSTDSTDMGGVITLSRELQAAIVCVWNRMPNGSDPLRIKHSLPVDIPQSYLRQLSGIFDYIAEGQLMYPFISLRYTQTELSEIISENDVALGRLVSGGLDHESDETTRKYVSASLSLRRYEGLFLLSSGGAGIYSSGIEPTESDDLDLYERTLFRAVQVCEVCLLEQRVLRTFKQNVDRDAKKVRIFPRPLLIERRREELLILENGLVRALPFRSPESLPLIRKAQEIFQIPMFLQEGKDSYDFLEKRYQNTKTTALALLAVATYVADKLNVWGAIKHLMFYVFRLK